MWSELKGGEERGGERGEGRGEREKSVPTCTIRLACDAATKQLFSRIVGSSLSGISSTEISTNRFRKALERPFLPPYKPDGFWVANSIKSSWGLTTSSSSGTYNSRLSSKSLFKASNTSEGAKLSSSNMIQYPCRRA